MTDELKAAIANDPRITEDATLVCLQCSLPQCREGSPECLLAELCPSYSNVNINEYHRRKRRERIARSQMV